MPWATSMGVTGSHAPNISRDVRVVMERVVDGSCVAPASQSVHRSVSAASSDTAAAQSASVYRTDDGGVMPFLTAHTRRW